MKGMNAWLSRVLVSALLIGPARGGYAEDGGMEELLFGDVPVVVSATLKEQNVLDAPASITVVTAEQIKERGYKTIKDMMNDIPGFTDISDSNEEVAAVRGAYTTTTNKILTLVNGHRMNDVQLGRYNLDQFIGMDIVKQVEFVRGAGSALFGTGALVGVVNIITRKGSDLGGSYARATAGSFANMGSSTWGGVKGDTDVLFNFTYLDAKGEEIKQPAALDVVPTGGNVPPSSLGQTKQDGVIYWHRYPRNWSAFVSLQKPEESSLDIRSAHFVRVTPRSNNGSFYDYEQETFKPQYTENDTYVNYKRIWRFGDDGKLTFNPSFHHYQYFEYSFIGSFGANRVPPYGLNRGPTQSESHMTQLKLYYEDQLASRLNVTVGFDGILANLYRNDTVSVSNGAGGGAIVFTPNGYAKPGNWPIYGYLAQAIWTPLDDLTVTGGVRYDTFDTAAAPEWTPRLGIVYKPARPVTLKALYGTSYLAPQWVHTRSGDPAFLGNPNLEPERFQGMDFIADVRQGPFSITLDYFRNQIRGLISQVGVEYQNVGKQVYQGVDSTVALALTPALSLTAGHSYIDPEGGTTAAHLLATEIKNIPTHSYRYGVKAVPLSGLVLAAWGRTYEHVNVSDPLSGNNRLPSWSALDVSVNYTVKNWDFQLLGTNVLDKFYEIGQAGSAARPLPRHGAGVEGSVGWKFGA